MSKRRAWSIQIGFNKTRILPSGLELRLQRLRWWQSVVRYPEDNVQLFAAMYDSLDDNRRPVLTNEGEIEESAHAWALQLSEDIKDLAGPIASVFLKCGKTPIIAVFRLMHQESLPCDRCVRFGSSV